jgi:hypothetical protein
MLQKDKNRIIDIAFIIKDFQTEIERLRDSEKVKACNINTSQAEYTQAGEKFDFRGKDLEEVYTKMSEMYHLLIDIGS